MKINRSPGFSIIVGNLGDRADETITVTRPDGTGFTTRSGSKLEFGPGGLEAMLTKAGVYTLQFLGERFDITVDGKTTLKLEFGLKESLTA